MITVTAVLTHPVQYYAAWFRHIAAFCPDIDLTVLYGTTPTPEQQGVGFGQPFRWDTPLLEGYKHQILRPARPGDRVDSEHFFGLDVPQIGHAIAATRPDAVLITGWYSVTLVRALLACRRRRIPAIYRGDTHLQSGPQGLRRSLWHAKTRWLLRRFDACLSVGRRSEAFLRYFGVPDNQVFRAPHSVENERFATAAEVRRSPGRRAAVRRELGVPEDAWVVLFVGKLESKKRPVDLVSAAARLDRPIHLLVAGSGPLESECRALAAQLGVSVTWAGFRNQRELPDVYAAADCLALPSDWGETWGLVVNEALAGGLPCVVSDRAGCAPDLVADGTTGAVFPAGDAHALGQAIADVRRRHEAGHDFSGACIARAAEYSFENASRGLLDASLLVHRRSAAAVTPKRALKPRIVACCGSMVIVGGLERMTFEVLRTMREGGAAIHCIVNTWDNQRIVALAERSGASWSTGYYWYGFKRTTSVVTLARLTWDALMTSAGLLRDVWRFRATHVFLSEFHTVLRNMPALWLLRLLGVGVVMRLGNAPEPWRRYRLIWRWAVHPFVDQFVCNSDFTRRALSAHGVPEAKSVRIAHTPPRRMRTRIPAHTPIAGRIVYVGQVVPAKGVDVLLDAVGLLVARGCAVSLDVVGDMDDWVPPALADYRPALRERASAQDLSGRIRFLGYCEDVGQILALAEVHCCPSRVELREGFGIVVIEAKRAGLPSVVTPSGALPELIQHGIDGWVCEDESAASIAEGIAWLLSDRQRCLAASRAALASSHRFGHEQFAREWRKVFGLEPGNDGAADVSGVRFSSSGVGEPASPRSQP